MSREDFADTPWLCRGRHLHDKYYLLELRNSDLPRPGRVSFTRPYPFLIEADEFQWRVSLAFRLVSRFWIFHLRNFQAHHLLAPVPREVMIVVSWIFGRDFSDQGAFYLRLALSGLWSFNPDKTMSEPEFLLYMGKKMIL